MLLQSDAGHVLYNALDSINKTTTQINNNGSPFNTALMPSTADY